MLSTCVLINKFHEQPDITAPGINILAAFTKLKAITDDPADTWHTMFNIVSGTSMACPHATGAAAYVKSLHPDWSPAAIKSALMTTGEHYFPTMHLVAINHNLCMYLASSNFSTFFCSFAIEDQYEGCRDGCRSGSDQPGKSSAPGPHL